MENSKQLHQQVRSKIKPGSSHQPVLSAEPTAQSEHLYLIKQDTCKEDQPVSQFTNTYFHHQEILTPYPSEI